MIKMQLLIVTGMSGAGKSQAANVLEDMGFYCVDNIPPAIIPSFVELSNRSNGEMGRIAIVTDARGGDMFNEISDVLDGLTQSGIGYKILFLDASDNVLVHRYKENRRKHPLCDRNDISLTDAVALERKMLSRIRFRADYIVDTSLISATQLKSQLSDIFLDNKKGGIKILCKSFGFKYGNDVDADIIFDVRCLPNPFYIDDLKHKTGLEKEVRDYVMDSTDSVAFLEKVTDFVNFSIPLYIKEGKSQLIISFGCTGGKHRSVTFAERLNAHLSDKGYNSVSIHRDINK